MKNQKQEEKLTIRILRGTVCQKETARAGDVFVDVPANEARYLIATGKAEEAQGAKAVRNPSRFKVAKRGKDTNDSAAPAKDILEGPDAKETLAANTQTRAG